VTVPTRAPPASKRASQHVGLVVGERNDAAAAGDEGFGDHVGVADRELAGGVDGGRGLEFLVEAGGDGNGKEVAMRRRGSVVAPNVDILVGGAVVVGVGDDELPGRVHRQAGGGLVLGRGRYRQSRQLVDHVRIFGGMHVEVVRAIAKGVSDGEDVAAGRGHAD
jgi:hypothetical protein